MLVFFRRKTVLPELPSKSTEYRYDWPYDGASNVVHKRIAVRRSGSSIDAKCTEPCRIRSGVQRRAEILAFVKSKPELHDPIPVEFMTREERVDNAARKVN